MAALKNIFILLLTFWVSVMSASAQMLAVVETPYARSTLIAEDNAFVPGKPITLALRQELQPGWHVFWVNPGDAGMPLSLSWDAPEGFEFSAIDHPAPHYIPVGPLASYAHEGAPVFLFTITPPDNLTPGESVVLGASAQWQVCREICVLEEATFSFELPVSTSAEPYADQASLFAEARAARARPRQIEATISPTVNGFELRAALEDITPRDVFFFAQNEGVIDAAADQHARVQGNELTLSLKKGWAGEIEESPFAGVLRYRDRVGAHHAIAITAEVSETMVAKSVQRVGVPGGDGVPGGGQSLLVLILLSFFGGALLNAMPCVFPILFVKASALVSAAHSDRAVMRRHGFIYTIGVVATFMLLAAILIGLRSSGAAIGWGFHLQSPLVVAFSALILFGVALNLAGLFSLGESLTNVGETATRRGGDLGAFFTGALAVLVAAPCIGPLLTAPVGAALSRSTPAAFAIFIVLALGLAAPYLAISLSPAIAQRLPKPGAWMMRFKQALAFPVAAAAAYFVWVFARQSDALGLMLSALILAAAAAWLFEWSKTSSRATVLRGLSALVLVLAIGPLLNVQSKEAAPTAEKTSGYGRIEAVPYDADRLARLRAENRPVFIDFTAAWCVTCQVNKITVLRTTRTAKIFEGAGAVLMVADWTVRDPVITQALEAYGAPGVPFYVAYPAGGEAVILPPTLKSALIENAFNSAD